MAIKVTAAVIGGEERTFDNVSSIQELVDALDLDNPSVKINGKAASVDSPLSDYAYVSFGEKVKGGYLA